MKEFKAKCEAMGYIKTSGALKMNDNDTIIDTKRKRRTAEINWAAEENDNLTVNELFTMAESGDAEFWDDFDKGTWHPPTTRHDVTLNLKTICGNLSLK